MVQPVCAVEEERKEEKKSEMKRCRDTEKRSEINSAIEELSVLVIVKPPTGNHDAAHIPIKPFLSLCYLVLQVLDKIGPTMAVLRKDIHQNIKRLETMHDSNPTIHSNLVEILKTETTKGNAKKRFSCSKSVVWLTRSLDFSSVLFQAIAKDPEKIMEQLVQESYAATLAPWHGWISSAAFRVCVKLVPDTKAFMDLLREKEENCDTLREKMQIFGSLLVPFLEDIHSILKVYSLDMLKSN